MRRWIAAGAGALAFAAASLTTADPDLWGHLRFGLDLLRDRRLTSTDPYSFTQDRPWINHEWLSELQMALAYTAGGTTGLIWLKAALVVATLAIAWRVLRGVEVPIQLIALGVLVIGTGRVLKTLRPQLWSLALFALLCTWLAADNRRARRWLPLIFALWANMHGGWVVGAGVLALWAIGEVITDRTRASALALIGATTAIATLCTPYGWALWTFLWRTVGVNRAITEWQPLWTVPPAAWLPWLAAVAATLWSLRSNDPQRLPRALTLGFLAFMSLRVERVSPFFVLAAVIFVAAAIRSSSVVRLPSDARRAEEGRPSSVREGGPWQSVVVAVAMTVAAVFVGARATRCITVEGDWVPDAYARLLLDAAPPGRLLTTFDWGQYAIWHWGPNLRVSIDGRRETVYSDRRVEQDDAIVHGTEFGFSTLSDWRPEYVWLPAASTRTRDWLAAHGYRTALESEHSFISVRDDIEPPALPRTSTIPSPRCFPE